MQSDVQEGCKRTRVSCPGRCCSKIGISRQCVMLAVSVSAQISCPKRVGGNVVLVERADRAEMFRLKMCCVFRAVWMCFQANFLIAIVNTDRKQIEASCKLGLSHVLSLKRGSGGVCRGCDYSYYGPSFFFFFAFSTKSKLCSLRSKWT